MKKEDFNIDFNEKPRITGEKGKYISNVENVEGLRTCQSLYIRQNTVV